MFTFLLAAAALTPQAYEDTLVAKGERLMFIAACERFVETKHLAELDLTQYKPQARETLAYAIELGSAMKLTRSQCEAQAWKVR